jgi:hypothetical protein
VTLCKKGLLQGKKISFGDQKIEKQKNIEKHMQFSREAVGARKLKNQTNF